MTVVEQERTETLVTEAADVWRRAADLLEEFDWCQHRAGSKAEGRMCAVGAISEAVRDLYPDQLYGPLWVRVCGLMGSPNGDLTMWPVAIWNDAAGRTKAEVVALLRAAADAHEADVS